MRRIAIIAALAAALSSGSAWAQANLRPDPTPRVPPQPGQSLPVEDTRFLKEASAASEGQASLGRMAAEKAPDDASRALAQRIADTHKKLGDDLKRLIQGRQLPPADQLKPERADGTGGAVTNPSNAPSNAPGGMAKDAEKSLSGLSGEAFGKGYIEWQLRIHDRLVDLYQTEASGTPDRELATFAITHLVTIQKDRDALRQMAGRFGIKAPAEGQAIQYGDPTKAR